MLFKFLVNKKKISFGFDFKGIRKVRSVRSVSEFPINFFVVKAISEIIASAKIDRITLKMIAYNGMQLLFITTKRFGSVRAQRCVDTFHLRFISVYALLIFRRRFKTAILLNLHTRKNSYLKFMYSTIGKDKGRFCWAVGQDNAIRARASYLDIATQIPLSHVRTRSEEFVL